jgi:hypothetical protein
MAITAKAPAGGTVADLGGESRPLVLRNGEIERFERQHNLGIFAMLEMLLGGGSPQARHCRDLVALGLVGGGMTDQMADAIVESIPPHENVRLRAVAQDVIFAAFVSPEMAKKKAPAKAGASKMTDPQVMTPPSK